MIKKKYKLEKGRNRRRRLEYIFEARYKVASLTCREIFDVSIHKFLILYSNINKISNNFTNILKRIFKKLYDFFTSNL
jgi:hypothetical protein